MASGWVPCVTRQRGHAFSAGETPHEKRSGVRKWDELPARVSDTTRRAIPPRIIPVVRGLARFILGMLTAMSLLLCGATVVLWVRSYRVADQWRNETGPGGQARDDESISLRERSVICSRGAVRLQDRTTEWLMLYGYLHSGNGASWTHTRPPPPGYPLYVPSYPNAAPPIHKIHTIGFEVVWTRPPPPGFAPFIERTTSVTLPFWLLSLTFALLPAIALWRRRKKCRHAARPGFPLVPARIATPTRCPERGAVPRDKRNTAWGPRRLACAGLA